MAVWHEKKEKNRDICFQTLSTNHLMQRAFGGNKENWPTKINLLGYRINKQTN